MTDIQSTQASKTAEIVYTSALEQRIAFFLVFVGACAVTFAFFFVIDFLPEKPASPTDTAIVATSPVVPVTDTHSDTSLAIVIDPFPITIIFDSLDKKEVTVLNPESREISDLDAGLLKGVVRHPDSADFERTGTIVLFGHSSYLPHVINKNFQAFNGIQKLVWGDIIRLRSHDTEYLYSVDREYKASAMNAEVKVEKGSPRLTLVTCNSFGTKDDRFVVEATLVEVHHLDDVEKSNG